MWAVNTLYLLTIANVDSSFQVVPSIEIETIAPACTVDTLPYLIYLYSYNDTSKILLVAMYKGDQRRRTMDIAHIPRAKRVTMRMLV